MAAPGKDSVSAAAVGAATADDGPGPQIADAPSAVGDVYMGGVTEKQSSAALGISKGILRSHAASCGPSSTLL